MVTTPMMTKYDDDDNNNNDNDNHHHPGVIGGSGSFDEMENFQGMIGQVP